jgi:redox-sensitive bicupin YhaK (pirin superfamily)
LLNGQIPNVPLPQDAGTVRVIAGEYSGQKGPAKTFTPINLWDVNLQAGAKAELPLPEGHTTALLVLTGGVTLDGDRAAGEGDLAIFDHAGSGVVLKATADSKLLVMSGEPIAEPVGRPRPVRDEQPRRNPASVRGLPTRTHGRVELNVCPTHWLTESNSIP